MGMCYQQHSCDESQPGPYQLHMHTPSCFVLPNGADYRGNTNTTTSGRQCQNWASQTPHGHDQLTANPYMGIGDHNFCRNPDGEPGPWCYTTDPEIRWELCDVGSKS